MITIGYCSPGTVATAFHESVLDLLLSDPKVTKRITITGGPRIASHRNEIVRMFLEDGNEWLFMVDSDMIFNVDICKRFLDAANEKIRPVVGGLCFGGGRVGHPFPTLYTLTNPKLNSGKMTKVIRDYPKDALCKVDATGAAALFIHRSVLSAMGEEYKHTHDGYPNPQPWFGETVYKGFEMGEDWTFCAKLVAMEVQLYVHTGIKLGHYKTHNYNEEFYNQWRKTNGSEG
jgi:hypothetical protein